MSCENNDNVLAVNSPTSQPQRSDLASGVLLCGHVNAEFELQEKTKPTIKQQLT